MVHTRTVYGTSCSSNTIAGICKLMHFSNQLCKSQHQKNSKLEIIMQIINSGRNGLIKSNNIGVSSSS